MNAALSKRIEEEMNDDEITQLVAETKEKGSVTLKFEGFYIIFTKEMIKKDS